MKIYKVYIALLAITMNKVSVMALIPNGDGHQWSCDNEDEFSFFFFTYLLIPPGIYRPKIACSIDLNQVVKKICQSKPFFNRNVLPPQYISKAQKNNTTCNLPDFWSVTSWRYVLFLCPQRYWRPLPLWISAIVSVMALIHNGNGHQWSYSTSSNPKLRNHDVIVM